MNSKLLVVLAAVLMAGGMTARAHHSFAATYDETKTVKVEGNLVQFLFRNPHSFVHIMAPDENGQMQRWAVEWGSAGQLGNAGMTAESLEVTASVTLEKTDAGFTVTKSHLDLTARIPGADKAAFDKAAENAKAGCPISRLLKAEITLTTKLLNERATGA